jgi:hypothetical protein
MEKQIIIPHFELFFFGLPILLYLLMIGYKIFEEKILYKGDLCFENYQLRKHRLFGNKTLYSWEGKTFGHYRIYFDKETNSIKKKSYYGGRLVIIREVLLTEKDTHFLELLKKQGLDLF